MANSSTSSSTDPLVNMSPLRLLLILRSSGNNVGRRLPDQFHHCVETVKSTSASLSSRLYVYPLLPAAVVLSDRIAAVKSIYAIGAAKSDHIDLRVIKNWSGVRDFDKVYYCGGSRQQADQDVLKLGLAQAEIVEWTEEEESEPESAADKDDSIYDNVVIGGTFDRLHSGHKVLLTEALWRTRRRLTIGVTEGNMIANKTLHELILPCQTRIERLREFLSDCDADVEYRIVPITDPFGPSIVEDDLELIVGSEETARGCQKVNEKREEAGLNKLRIITVGLEADPEAANSSAADLEAKVSSSNNRKHLLGDHLFRRPLKPYDNDGSGPYVIGLTGGSASGKSSMSRRLAALGAGIVDCDKLGHAAYVEGTPCFHRVVEAFGRDKVVSPKGGIDRAALGRLVFGNADDKRRLEEIVWPEIRKMAEAETVRLFREEEKRVVILDAAVLLQARWHREICHEVWSCIIAPDEAVNRIVDRDGKSAEEARKRIEAQMSNAQVVQESNVVFCTQWTTEFSQSQAEKAWKRLHERIKL